jgi:5,10-methylenetetrahydromethanopterin reductase
MRIGMGLDMSQVLGQPSSLPEVVEQAKRADEAGFSTGWFVHTRALDATTVAAVCGYATTRIELGTSVVPIYGRHPLLLAQQALTTQVASGGRFVLGVGLSHRRIVEEMYGLSRARPYSYMVDYLDVLDPLVHEGKVAVENASFRLQAEVAFAGKSTCSIMLAALNPKMLELAGSRTDGTITFGTTPATLRDYVVPHLNDAAARAHRPRPRTVAGFPIAVTDDPAQARVSADEAFARFARSPAYRSMLDRGGADGLGDVAIVGDEDDVAEQLARLDEVGVTDFLAIPFPTASDGPIAVERTWELLGRLARQVRETHQRAPALTAGE